MKGLLVHCVLGCEGDESEKRGVALPRCAGEATASSCVPLFVCKKGQCMTTEESLPGDGKARGCLFVVLSLTLSPCPALSLSLCLSVCLDKTNSPSWAGVGRHRGTLPLCRNGVRGLAVFLVPANSHATKRLFDLMLVPQIGERLSLHLVHRCLGYKKRRRPLKKNPSSSSHTLSLPHPEQPTQNKHASSFSIDNPLSSQISSLSLLRTQNNTEQQ